MLFNQNLYNYINSDSEIYPKIRKLNDDIYIISGFWDTRKIIGENGPGILLNQSEKLTRKTIRIINEAIISKIFVKYSLLGL